MPARTCPLKTLPGDSIALAARGERAGRRTTIPKAPNGAPGRLLHTGREAGTAYRAPDKCLMPRVPTVFQYSPEPAWVSLFVHFPAH